MIQAADSVFTTRLSKHVSSIQRFTSLCHKCALMKSSSCIQARDHSLAVLRLRAYRLATNHLLLGQRSFPALVVNGLLFTKVAFCRNQSDPSRDCVKLLRCVSVTKRHEHAPCLGRNKCGFFASGANENSKGWGQLYYL